MSIDKDIHQGKFKNEYHKASVNILYTYSWLMEQIKQVLAEADITPPAI